MTIESIDRPDEPFTVRLWVPFCIYAVVIVLTVLAVYVSPSHGH